jgi:hypothetical protein
VRFVFICGKSKFYHSFKSTTMLDLKLPITNISATKQLIVNIIFFDRWN